MEEGITGKAVWEDNHPEPFTKDGLSISVSANLRFVVELTQDPARGAKEKNILWRFDAKAEFRLSNETTIHFDQVGFELRTDNDHKTVSTSVNRLR